MGRPLVALMLVVALAAAQEHAYAPDAAWLMHATDKWLVWRPDDNGASLDPPGESGEDPDQDGTEGGKKIKLPKMPDLNRAVFVLQSAADPKERRKIVAEWKDPPKAPTGIRPVTVLDDGTIVLAGLKRDELLQCRQDGEPLRYPLLARDHPAVLVAAYPDGIVLQTPRPDELSPRGPLPKPKRVDLYWADWGNHGLESEKARKISFHEGVITTFEVHVARFGDDVAIPGGIYSPRRRARKRFSSDLAASIYAFDGRVALGSDFSFSVRESDRLGMLDGHEYFLARAGIGYWLEKGDGSRWTIRACPLREPKKAIPLGTVRYGGKLSPHEHIEGSTLALEDPDSKTRFTIYWTDDRLQWTGEDGWQSRAWLKEADFK